MGIGVLPVARQKKGRFIYKKALESYDRNWPIIVGVGRLADGIMCN